MTRFLLLTLATTGLTSAWAQQSTSAVWMQRNQTFGTARYNGSAGALAAFGGDGTSGLENPALMNSTPFGGLEITGHYRNDQTSLSSQGSGIGQAYMAGSWRVNSRTRMSVGLAYQQDAWFPNYWIDSEQNPQTSAVAHWIEESNGFSPEQLLAQGRYDAYVAYMGYLTDVGSGASYSAYADGLPTYRQTRFVREYRSTSWSVPIALKTEKFSVGVRIERRDGRAQERLSLTESGFNPSGVTAAYTKNVVDSTRWGQWTVRFGAAVQATPTLRLSAAVQPAGSAQVQWDYRNRVTPEATNPESNLTPFELYDDQEFWYQMPVQVQLGAAQTFGGRGVLSAVWVHTGDVEALISSPLNYYDLGRQMAEELQANQQFRLGGEYRLTEAWTARGGIQWSESGTTFADHSSFRMLGLGGGYQERDWTLDVAYQITARSGSIDLPATGTDWALPARQDRLTATYRVRF